MDPATDLELPSIPGAAESASTGGTRRFNDVHQGHKFYTPITWMYNEGLTTGVKGSHGVTNYLPGQQLTREAMAAFMYRQAGSPEFQIPSTGFVDITQSHKFYLPIMWMKATGLTGGVKTSNGLAYKPGSTLSREAMAAFLYRQAGKPQVSGVAFPDVPKSHKFYREITWMEHAKLTTGIKQPNGQILYKPYYPVTREAMASFLHRQAGNPILVESGKVSLSGTLHKGGTVKASLSGWSPNKGVDYQYQWLLNDKTIPGATGKTLKLDKVGWLKFRVKAVVPGIKKPITYTTGQYYVGNPPAPPASLEGLRTAFNDRMLTLINFERSRLGLGGVAKHDSQLQAGTEGWVDKQVTNQTFDHSPTIYWTNLGVTDAPSENLGRLASTPGLVPGSSTMADARAMADKAFKNWKNSPSHYAIMTQNGPQKFWSTFATGWDDFYKKDVTMVILTIRNNYDG